MGYQTDFTDILNRQAAARKKQAEATDAFVKGGGLLSNVKNRVFAMKDSLMDNSLVNGVMEAMGMVIKETSNWSLYLYLEKDEETDVEDTTEYNITFNLVDSANDAVADIMKLDVGKTYDLRVTVKDGDGQFASTPVFIQIQSPDITQIRFVDGGGESTKVYIEGENLVSFKVISSESNPKTYECRSSFFSGSVNDAGKTETYKYHLMMTHKTKEPKLYKDIAGLNSDGQVVWKPQAILTYLGANRVQLIEAFNIIRQTCSDPKYDPLQFPLIMQMIVSSSKTAGLDVETIYPSYQEAADLAVELTREIVEGITRLNDFRDNLATILGAAGANKMITVADFFKFDYEISVSADVVESPVKYTTNTIFKYTTNITTYDDDGNIKKVERPADIYGPKAESIDTMQGPVDISRMIHYLYDDKFGNKFVCDVISKHEKKASDGSFFGIAKAKIKFNITKGIVNLVNKQIEEARKKAIADMSKSVDNFKSSSKVKSALKAGGDVTNITGKEKSDKTAYFKNLANSIKDDVTTKKKLDDINSKITSIDCIKDNTKKNIYRDIDVDGSVELMLPLSETEVVLYTIKRTVTVEDNVKRYNDTKKVYTYNLKTKSVIKEYVNITGSTKENYYMKQDDMIRYLSDSTIIIIDSIASGIRTNILVKIPKNGNLYSSPTISYFEGYQTLKYHKFMSLTDNDTYTFADMDELFSYKINDIFKLHTDVKDDNDVYVLSVTGGFDVSKGVDRESTLGSYRTMNTTGLIGSSLRYMVLVITPNGITVENLTAYNMGLSNPNIARQIDKALLNITPTDDGLLNCVMLPYYSGNRMGLILSINITGKETFIFDNVEDLRHDILKYHGIANRDASYKHTTPNQSLEHIPGIKKDDIVITDVNGVLITSKVDDGKVYKWYDRYLKPQYTTPTTKEDNYYLSGNMLSFTGSLPYALDSVKDMKIDNVLVYFTPYRTSISRSINVPIIANNVIPPSYYIYANGDLILSKFWSDCEKEKQQNESKEKVYNSKLNSVLEGVKPTIPEIKLTLKEKKQTITLNYIELSDSSALEDAIESQLDMFTDIINELQGAKEKQDAVTNRQSKYFVTNYLAEKE